MVFVGETRVVTKEFWAGMPIEVGEILTVARVGFPSEPNSDIMGVIFEKYSNSRHNLNGGIGEPSCKNGHGWYMGRENLLRHTKVLQTGEPDWEI